MGAVPDFLQFSRSNFMFPQKQHFPHRAFSEETEYLNKLLGKEGDAFILGTLQGPRWHLYIVDFNEVDASQYKQQTCELIMFNLDPQIMRQFYQAAKQDEAAGAAASSSSSTGPTPMEESKEEVLVNTSGQGYANLNGEGSKSGDDATKRSGIDKLLPGADIDGFLFNPCGYCTSSTNTHAAARATRAPPRNAWRLLCASERVADAASIFVSLFFFSSPPPSVQRATVCWARRTSRSTSRRSRSARSSRSRRTTTRSRSPPW